MAEGTPIEELVELMGASTAIFASVLAEALPRVDLDALSPTGTLYRFD